RGEEKLRLHASQGRGDLGAALSDFTSALALLRREGSGRLPSLEASKEASSLEAEALLGRACARLRLREWTAALEAAQSSLSLQPESTDAMYCQGIALKELGQTEKARARLGWVLLKDPRHKMAKVALAAIMAEKRSPAEAQRQEGKTPADPPQT
ncbi:unnamed protein product, partial [Polarella glacialis]